jgi:hypothetical protein
VSRGSSEQPSQKNSTGLLLVSILGGIGGVCAISGIIYAVGLFGLWVQFSTRYDHVDLSTAWEAAFYVNRSQVIGFGVELLWNYIPLGVFVTGIGIILTGELTFYLASDRSTLAKKRRLKSNFG